MTRRLASGLAALAVALACAPRLDRPGQRDRDIAEDTRVAFVVAALEESRERWDELIRVSERVRRAGALACRPNVVALLGAYLVDPADYRRDPILRRAAERVFDLGEEQTIAALAPDSPLARAGARVGDGIVAVNGREIRDADALEKRIAEDVVPGADPFTIRVRRGEGSLDLTVEPVPGCRDRVALEEVDDILLASEGLRVERSPDRWLYTITVSRGVMDLTRSEDELAMVLAHLVAHGPLETAGDPREASRRRHAYHQAQIVGLELAADDLGLELAARAGYDVRAAIPFWERLAIEEPGWIDGRSHGYVAHRLDRMRLTVAAIRGAGWAAAPGAGPAVQPRRTSRDPQP